MAQKDSVQSRVDSWVGIVESWFDAEVHGKGGFEIIGIAGDVVVSLDDSWDKSDVTAARDSMEDYNIPVYATRGTDQIRIDAQEQPIIL